MNFAKNFFDLYIVALLGLFASWNGSSASAGVLLKTEESLPQCLFNNPVETGRIQEPELREASGLVASHQNPGVYYSIQDSLNPSNVYAVKYNGDALGKFDLEGIKQDDWEDITMLEYNGVNYIYIADTGNNYDGHCRGIDYADMRVIRFPEPDLERFKNGLATIPASEITIMTLKNPNQPATCDDRTKQDFECLMADPISGDVYLVQKNVFEPDVSLYKFTPTENSETIMLTEVGKITSNLKQVGGPAFPWPMGITAGDISIDGTTILVRNYPVLRVWKRADGQSVEDAILQNEPCEFKLRDEPLGESVAIRDDSAGFLTTSDGQVNAPIYFYEDL